MKQGEKCESKSDLEQYIQEVREYLKAGRKAEAFDRIADLDNVWVPDNKIPSYLTYQEWKDYKKLFQGLMREL